MGTGASSMSTSKPPKSTGGYGFKCLVLGETGSGKTTFMNLLCNLKSVLDLQSRDLDPACLRRFEHETKTEDPKNEAGKSRTKSAHPYIIPPIPGLEREITLIDTPGFGDTEGIDEDKKHVSKINAAIEQEGSINCIVLVINGRMARATGNFKYVVANVMAILPKEILSQIVVIFTNCNDIDQVNIDLEAVHNALGFQLSEDYMLAVENPVASVPKLLRKGMGNEALKRRMKGLKHQITSTAEMLSDFFLLISNFQPVPTNLFREMFQVKTRIEQDSFILNKRLQDLNRQKLQLAKAEEELKSAEDTRKVYEDFSQKREEERWLPDYCSSGQHNMICTHPGCHSNCHLNCKIEMGFEKVEVFKDCECFHWKDMKTIKIETETHRSDLLCQVCDKEFTFLDTEQDIKKSTEYRLASDKNFTVNGVTVRGQPLTTWLNRRFCSTAIGDENTSMKQVRQAGLPYEVNIWDWSNVERGTGMICKTCNHPLSDHQHQTTIWKKVKETKVIIDIEAQKQFNKFSTEVEKQEVLKKILDVQVAQLAAAEQEVKNKLRDNLTRFGHLSGKSSYVGLLNDQTSFLEQLLRNAKHEGKKEMQEHLKEQLSIVEALRKAAFTVAAAA